MAGSFSNTLTDPNNTTGYSVNGSGTLADGSSWMPVVQDGHLSLTVNQGGLNGTVVLDDLDSGQAIESFTAKFKLLLSGSADGMAFCFGPDITTGITFGETGPGMGGGGLAVSFDLYNNGVVNDVQDVIGLSVILNGVEIGLTPLPLSSTEFKETTIQLNKNGTLNLIWGGETIYTNLFLPGYTPVAGQFGFGARTGGASADQAISGLTITTTVAGAATAAKITSQPQSQSVNEHGSASFQVGFDGTPPFTFQWYKNGTAIPDATANVLALSNVSPVDTGAKFKCDVSNTSTVTSQEATLTVKADTTAPTLVSVVGSTDFVHVQATFSEEVSTATAEDANNYKIQGLTVTSAVLSTNDFLTVLLTTSTQTSGTEYTLLISGVKDTSAAGNTIVANTKATFRSEAFKVSSVGAIPSSTGSTYDVGVSFSLPYDQTSAAAASNYKLSAGTISSVTAYPGSPAVLLKVSGLTVGESYTVTVSNVKDKGGSTLPTVTVPFTVSKMKWGVVGGDRYNLGNAVVAGADGSFDIYSDGATEWNNYDEATFVYEEITGDFDKKVRVEYQDASSQWARAGLIARDVTNFGVTDTEQFGSGSEGNTGTAPFDGKAGRYQKIHVNPVLTVTGGAGNNSWEGNRRIYTGGPSSSAGGGGTPQYPNAWCRLKRSGQTFTIYRSDDGSKWIELGSTTWPDSADPDKKTMPNTVFVGPEYSPENGNISDETQRGVWLAKMRDYGDTFPVTPTVPTVAAARTSSGLQITYTGTLQSAPAVTGPWADVAGATSPYSVTAAPGALFYKSKK